MSFLNYSRYYLASRILLIAEWGYDFVARARARTAFFSGNLFNHIPGFLRGTLCRAASHDIVDFYASSRQCGKLDDNQLFEMSSNFSD